MNLTQQWNNPALQRQQLVYGTMPAIYRPSLTAGMSSRTYTGGVAYGSSGWGACKPRWVDADATPESVPSYSSEDSGWNVMADSMSDGLRADRRNDISYCAADSGCVDAAVSGWAAAVRGVVFLCVEWRDRTKLLFCMRRVLACHFLNDRSCFSGSSSAMPKNFATPCLTDLQANFHLIYFNQITSRN